MALIKCPECEKEISDKAAACPNCGCPSNDFSKAIEEKSENTNDIVVDQEYKNKRKKEITIAIILGLSLIITIIIISCVALFGKPSNVSDQMYDYGISTIKTIDSYLDNEIDYNTAYTKLNGLSNNASAYSETSNKTSSNDLNVRFKINNVNSILYMEHLGVDTYSDLLKARNELAKELNVSTK